MFKETQVSTPASSDVEILSSWWTPGEADEPLHLLSEIEAEEATVEPEPKPAEAVIGASAPTLPADATSWARPREFSHVSRLEPPLTRVSIGARSLETTVTGLQAIKSPLMNLNDVIEAHHVSSQHLATLRAADGMNLLDKFTRPDCLMDMSIAPDGTVSAALTAGCRAYKRTIVCRPDGTYSQRVVGPGGQELVRIRSDAQGIQTVDPLKGIKTRLST